MPTTKTLNDLKIVRLTKEQYDMLIPEDDTFYITTDENDILFGTDELIPGSSNLTTGKLYVCYE